MVIKLGQLVRLATTSGKPKILVDWRPGQLNTRLLLLSPEDNSLELYAVPNTVAEPVLAKALEAVREEKYIEIEIAVDELTQRAVAMSYRGVSHPAEEVIKRIYNAKLPANHVIIEMEAAKIVSLGDRFVVSENGVSLNLFQQSLFTLSQKYLIGIEKMMSGNDGLVHCLIGLALNPRRALQIGIDRLDEEVVAKYASSLSTFTTAFLFIPVDILGSEDLGGGGESEPPGETVDRSEQGEAESVDEDAKEMIKKMMEEVLGGAEDQ